MVSDSVSSWVPALTSLDVGLWPGSVSKISPFLSKLFKVMVIYHSNRNAKTKGLLCVPLYETRTLKHVLFYICIRGICIHGISKTAWQLIAVKCLLNKWIVVVCMWNVLHKLMCLNTCSPAGITVWECCGLLGQRFSTLQFIRAAEIQLKSSNENYG